MYKTWTNPTILIFRNLYYRTFMLDGGDTQNGVSCDLFDCCLIRLSYDPGIGQTTRDEEELGAGWCKYTPTFTPSYLDL